jgi:ATP diphosphatase
LLLQVVFHAQMAQERNEFAFGDVVRAIVAKMIRRHPHVFADASVADAQAQTVAWEDIKAAERVAAGKSHDNPLADVPVGLAALQRAAKLQKCASRLGFDWPELAPVMAKLREEIAELEVEIEIAANADVSINETRNRIGEELGDVLFSVVNLARHLDVDPEGVLVAANARFTSRFNKVCEQAGGANAVKSHSLEQLEVYWQRAKI